MKSSKASLFFAVFLIVIFSGCDIHRGEVEIQEVTDLTIEGTFHLDRILVVPEGGKLTIVRGATVLCNGGGILCYGDYGVESASTQLKEIAVTFAGFKSRVFFGVRFYDVSPIELKNFVFTGLRLQPLPEFYLLDACKSTYEVRQLCNYGPVEYISGSSQLTSSLIDAHSLIMSNISVERIAFDKALTFPTYQNKKGLPTNGALFHSYQFCIRDSVLSDVQGSPEYNCVVRRGFEYQLNAYMRRREYISSYDRRISNIQYERVSFSNSTMFAFDNEQVSEQKRMVNCDLRNVAFCANVLRGNLSILDCKFYDVSCFAEASNTTKYLFDCSGSYDTVIQNCTLDFKQTETPLGLLRGSGQIIDSNVEYKRSPDTMVLITGNPELAAGLEEEGPSRVLPRVLLLRNTRLLCVGMLLVRIDIPYGQVMIEHSNIMASIVKIELVTADTRQMLAGDIEDFVFPEKVRGWEIIRGR